MKAPGFRLQIVLKGFSYALLFCSCKKSEQEPEPIPLPPQTGVNCRLDSVVAKINDGITTEYITTSYEYNDQNQPVRKLFNGVPYNVYLYGTDNRLASLQTIGSNSLSTFVSDETFFQYDPQGRISGYILKEYFTSNAPLEVKINYSDSLITYYAIKNGDSCCTKYSWYENGNVVRILGYIDTLLVYDDSITYKNALDRHFPGKEINMFTYWSQTPTSKNLPIRHTSYSPLNSERSMDESYSYVFDSEGKIVKRNKYLRPTTSWLGSTTEERWFYKCE